jgi:transmembrane sensor
MKMTTESKSMQSEARTKAAAWLIELYTADSIGPMLPEFTQWLDAAPENRSEYLYLEDLWRAMDEMKDRARWDAREQSLTAPTPSRRYGASLSWRWTSLWKYGVAAMMLAAICSAVHWWDYIPWDGKFSKGQHTSDYGKTVVLNLVDGSSVTLSGNSEVTLDFSEVHRRVSLDRGDALFQVKKNDAVPFDVNAGSLTVRAVGTIFGVKKSAPDAVETVVQDGRVQLFTTQNRRPFLLQAGQVAKFEGGKIQLQQPTPSKVDARLSWTAGLLSFTDAPLSQVVQEFNLHNRGQIVVDADIADQPISGLYAVNDPEGFADAMGSLWGFRHSVSRAADTGVETIRLSGKRPPGVSPYRTGDRNSLEEKR